MKEQKNKWIRIRYNNPENRTILGHAGRRGFILPNDDKQTNNAKFVAKSYDGIETHWGDLVGDLKRIMDAE